MPECMKGEVVAVSPIALQAIDPRNALARPSRHLEDVRDGMRGPDVGGIAIDGLPPDALGCDVISLPDRRRDSREQSRGPARLRPRRVGRSPAGGAFVRSRPNRTDRIAPASVPECRADAQLQSPPSALWRPRSPLLSKPPAPPNVPSRVTWHRLCGHLLLLP